MNWFGTDLINFFTTYHEIIRGDSVITFNVIDDSVILFNTFGNSVITRSILHSSVLGTEEIENI